jgi:hypothetical protein
VVVLRIEDRPAGPVIHLNISWRWSLLLPQAPIILPSVIEPIIIFITARLLLDQPLHLLFASSTTRLGERGHIISTSVIELEITPDIIHILFVNKKVTKKGLIRLG